MATLQTNKNLPNLPPVGRRGFLQGMLASACGLCLPSLQLTQAASELIVPGRKKIEPGHQTLAFTDIICDPKKSGRWGTSDLHSDEHLISSMRDIGMINPLVCTLIDDDPYRIELVCGFRRYHAVAVLGPKWPQFFQLPVSVHAMSGSDIIGRQLMEPLPRIEMTDTEIRIAVRNCINSIMDGVRPSYTRDEAIVYLAKQLGRTKHWVVSKLS